VIVERDVFSSCISSRVCVYFCAFSVKLGELDDALDNFNRALELAKTQSDKAAESAIRRAIDDVNNTIDKQVRRGPSAILPLVSSIFKFSSDVKISTC
jgi:hypothetical protein